MLFFFPPPPLPWVSLFAVSIPGSASLNSIVPLSSLSSFPPPPLLLNCFILPTNNFIHPIPQSIHLFESILNSHFVGANMVCLLLPLLLFVLFLPIPQIVSTFSPHIRIWRILASFPQKRPDLKEEARQEFTRAMGPEKMAEMWKVRRDLEKMRRRTMANWEAAGLMGPSALLAQAMIFEEQRASDPKRKSRNSVSVVNRPIDDFMYQGDILLDSNQSRQMLANLEGGPLTILIGQEEEEVEEELNGSSEEAAYNEEEATRRRRRQAQTGRNFPRNQWDPQGPIPFVFDPKVRESTRKLVRLATQFWTDNTCLSFSENGAGTPRVKFFPGGGCYSQVGRAFHQREQLISLGRGCEQFGIAAHEIGHTLGFFHGQARFDRDQFVNVVYSNLSPQMAGQFVKQTPEDNFNFGITYDYGSIMHYSDTDVATNRVTMLAKERIYQHTMGNNVKPSFLDVLEMNLYYKCTDHCDNAANGANCKNGGYRHPRDCAKCMCPDGFGGIDCADRASPAFGALQNCGATLEAKEGPMQTVDGAVSAAVAENGGGGMAERHAQCWWHIRAPSGKRVQLRLKSVSGACSDGCFYGGIEVKTRDFLRVGARICCRTDVRPLGLLYSNTELAMVSAFSQFKTQRFSVEYRAVDASIVPRGGVGNYDELEGMKKGGGGREEAATEQGKGKGGGGGGKVEERGECRDIAGNCFRFCRIWQKICRQGRSQGTKFLSRQHSLLHLCENALYRALMNRQCAKSCMRCGEGENREGEEAEGGGGSAKSGRGGGDAGGMVGQCGTRDHESCHTWANNGFCQSSSYSLQIKRQICPRECRLC